MNYFIATIQAYKPTQLFIHTKVILYLQWCDEFSNLGIEDANSFVELICLGCLNCFRL